MLDRDLPLAVDVLTDLVRRPLLRQADLDLERNVILEEIGGVDDTPDDLVFELHSRALWPTHPYGYSILGTRETVGALMAEDLRRLHDEAYYPGNCVIAAAGNLDHQAFLALLEKEGWFEGEARPARDAVRAIPAERGKTHLETRDTTQSHIVLGTDTFSIGDSRRFAISIVVNALGGGMSSRLFQRVREELGLAYAVYAFNQFHQGTGQLGIYVGTRPETAESALEAIQDELRRMATEGMSQEEAGGGEAPAAGTADAGAGKPGGADGPAGELHPASRAVPYPRHDHPGDRGGVGVAGGRRGRGVPGAGAADRAVAGTGTTGRLGREGRWSSFALCAVCAFLNNDNLH